MMCSHGTLTPGDNSKRLEHAQAEELNISERISVPFIREAFGRSSYTQAFSEPVHV